MAEPTVSFNFNSEESDQDIKEFAKTHKDAPLLILEKVQEDEDDFTVQMIEFNIEQGKRLIKEIQEKINFVEG